MRKNGLKTGAARPHHGKGLIISRSASANRETYVPEMAFNFSLRGEPSGDIIPLENIWVL